MNMRFFYLFTAVMDLIEVNSASLAKDFIRVNVELNSSNPNYIRPLDKDINDVFDKKKNKVFRIKGGEAIRWILKKDGKLIGRIAAFVNPKYKNKGDEPGIGGVGFFDCINSQEAADILFDVSKHWLGQRGMNAMDGPINFGERDRWWGLVVDGFQEPLYCMNYNPPYYRELFERYGFKNFYNQVCFGLDPKKPLINRLYERHKHFSKDPAFSAAHITKKELDKFAVDFATIYNKAWAGHAGMKELSIPAVKKIFASLRPVLDERLSWFAYHNGDPIAMFINLPDLNQYFKHLNGKFDLFHKLKFLWLKKTMKCKKFYGLVFGIVPEWQGTGVDAYVIGESAKLIQPYTDYTEYEMQWIGDFNPKMINIVERLEEPFRSRKLTTYRYLFDPSREFKPHPIL